MKRILNILLIFAVLVSCKDDDNEIALSISSNNIEFTVSGGEQTIEITSDSDWECNYTVDWLFVRQQQNRIRIVVSENTENMNRTAIVQILCDGTTKEEIKVTQEGVNFDVENSNVTVLSSGEEIIIPVLSNTEWVVKNSIGWCNTKQDNNNLIVLVERNYQMKERTGTIQMKAGNILKEIALTQEACQWFESFEMVNVQEGEFFMGAQKQSATDENYDINAYQIESPVHRAFVNKYSIGKYEVTQAQWLAAMGDNPSAIQGENHPVESVSWEKVQEFIALLNDKTGLNYRLPTEAEWEFAAKGGNLSANNKYSGNSVLGACGWFYSNSESTTHEVGTKSPNELGIYDMSGNVREWCNDWFDYYGYNDVNNPKGPNTGSMKVNRGGSWTTPAVNCRNTYRHTDYPLEISQDLGFRLALSLE